MSEVLLPTFGCKQPPVGLGRNHNIEPLRGSSAGIAIHLFRGFHPRLLRFDAYSVGAAGLCPTYCAGSKAPEKHGGSRASALQKQRRHRAFVLPPRRRRYCSGGVPAAVFSTTMRTTRPDWSGSPLQRAVRGPPLSGCLKTRDMEGGVQSE